MRYSVALHLKTEEHDIGLQVKETCSVLSAARQNVDSHL